MAVRFTTTVYNEKGRKIIVRIKDNVFSGSTYSFDTISLGIQYDSESSQGQERFTPIIGSRCSLSLLINNTDLQNLLLDIGLAVEGRFTMEVIAFENASVINYRWYGYIVTDLVQFEDVPINVGYVAQIQAIDGIGWLKTLDYKSAVGPYIGQDTVVQHILNCLNQLDFVQENLVANSLPVLHTVFNWHENTTAFDADSDYSLNTVIQHRAFYHRDTKNNITYQSCYDVIKKICNTFGARLLFSGSQYWFIQVNEYSNTPTNLRYFKYTGFGVQVAGTFTEDFTINNNQTDIPNSDVVRFSGGKWTFYAALKNAVVRYNHFAKQNLLAGVVYDYLTNATPPTTITPTLDATNADARLSYTGILNFYATALNPANFEPFQFVFAVKVASIINSFPLQNFNSGDWTLTGSWLINDKILQATFPVTGEAFYTTFSVVSGKKYYVNIKVDIDNGANLRLRLGGVTQIITTSGNYEYIIVATNTDTLKLDSTSTPKFTGKITSLQVKQENKYLKRNVNYTGGFNFQLEAASWQNTPYEYEFNTETITADAAFVVYKTITFDTLDIPESAEFVWEMRLKEMRNEAGASIINSFAISFSLINNYLEFLPSGSAQGQSDILEYGSDNDDKSSTVFSLDTYIGDGPSKTTDGGLKVLEAGVFVNSSSWDVGSGQGFNNVTQLLVNEIIRGQLTPKLRMVDMPFQNLVLSKPYLPHKVIEYSGDYFVFERGTLDLKTDIWQGDFFKIELDA